MFKPFFHHYNRGTGKLPNRTPRGFTAFFTPEYSESAHVWMSVSWCSPKDEFNKKKGRKTAMEATPQVVRIRDVPGLLSGCTAICSPEYSQLTPSDFYWIYRYFL